MNAFINDTLKQLPTIRLITLLILLLTTGTLRAQLLGQFIESSQSVYVPFTVTNYGTKYGLPQNQVSDIISKEDGELIIATANGIVTFDGNSFQQCIPDKNYLLMDHWRLFYDPYNKSIYSFQISGTISRIAPDIRKIGASRSINSTPKGLIGCDANGVIWEFDYLNQHKKQLAKTGVRESQCILKDKDLIYFSDQKHLYCFNLKTKKSTIVANLSFLVLKKNTFNGKVYGITQNRLFRISRNGCKEISLSTPEPATLFNDLEFSPEGEFFVTSNTGLFYHHPAYNELYGKSSFLPTPYLVSLHYNKREHCLFLGSANKGLFKLNIKNCQTMTDYSEIGGEALNSVMIGENHSVYISTSQNKIYRFSIDGPDKMIDLNPVQIASTSCFGNLFFVGTWGEGLYVYKGKKRIDTVATPRLPNNQVFASFRDSQGKYWIGTNAGIATGSSLATIHPILKNQITGRIICFYERKNGDLCIGGSDGLFILDKTYRLKSRYRSDKEIVCKEIRSFLEDDEGKLWIATYNGGLYCLENGRMTSINNLPNCHLSQEVFTLAKNNNGDIYMSSNIGLWMVSEKKLNDFYHRKINYLIPFYYGNESGILNSEFNGGFQNNYMRTSYDHFYFPSIEGLVTVFPEVLTFHKIRPKIRSFLVDGKSAAGKHHFARNTRSLEFEYYTPTFLSKFNVHYQFRLSGPGIHPDWGEMQKEGNVRFEYLPPGEYELKVRAVDGFNDSHPTTSSYRFTIAAYWYETWWAIGIGLLLLIGLLFWIVRYRSRKIRHKQQRENSINNTLLELKLKAINAKMNPHFIFNTLNNIQYLIILNKNTEAEQALNRFSLLLRKFLEQSDHSFVRLSEEITLLKLYIDIEQFRFDDNLEVNIHIPTNCGSLVIPTLLLQPVIENSFKHGLAYSDKRNVLTISAQQKENYLEITIEDNGIGRNKSEEIKLGKTPHVSQGWRLVEEKIRMVHDKYGIVITCDITDKPDTDPGTIVVFRIAPIDEGLLRS